MTGFYREAGALVPFHRGTGVVSFGAFTAKLKQTPAFFCPFIVKGFSEFALFKERPSVTSVVDGAPKKGQRPFELIKRW